MTDIDNIKFSCSNLADISDCLSSVAGLLPSEMADRLLDIFLEYLRQYGIDEAFERMNNRTVSQIFAGFRPSGVKPIVTGEVDGVQYALFEAPSSNAANGKRSE